MGDYQAWTRLKDVLDNPYDLIISLQWFDDVDSLDICSESSKSEQKNTQLNVIYRLVFAEID